jgi:SAM-dependent methyltransferase
MAAAPTSPMPSDKEIERQRYDERARIALHGETEDLFQTEGARSIPLPLRTPYLVYEKHIEHQVRPGSRVLDLCGGTGLHALTAARSGGDVTIVDIAPHNLALAERRATQAGLRVKTAVADGDSLPFADASFDVVICAGSLSYLDHDRLLLQLGRIMSPGGAFIFVDSFNHGPIYRLNRYIGYLRGRRSRSTLQRMPNDRLIARLRGIFPDLAVSYHGVLSFLGPLLAPLTGALATARLLDRFDTLSPPWLKKLSFKIVGVGHLPSGGASPPESRSAEKKTPPRDHRSDPGL